MQTWDRLQHKGVIVVSQRNVRVHVHACSFLLMIHSQPQNSHLDMGKDIESGPHQPQRCV